jgi:hypothetical protein
MVGVFSGRCTCGLGKELSGRAARSYEMHKETNDGEDKKNVDQNPAT